MELAKLPAGIKLIADADGNGEIVNVNYRRI